jgi:hypothetical protein
MPKGDPAGYLPNVQQYRSEKGGGKGKRRFGKKKSGKSAPIQTQLRSGSRPMARPAR